MIHLKLAFLMFKFLRFAGLRHYTIYLILALIGNKLGKWDIETRSNYLIIFNKKNSAKNAILLMNYLWKTEGVSNTLREILKCDVAYNSTKDKASYYMLCCAIYNELDEQKQSISCYEKSKNLQTNIDIDYLKSSVEIQQLLNIPVDQMKEKIYIHLKNNLGKFPKIITDNPRSVITIGNAPTELDKDNQLAIDSANCIIRFNNFQVGPDFIKGYGSKLDIWIRTPSKGEIPYAEPKSHIVFLSGFNIFTLKNSIWRELEHYIDKAEVYLFNEQYFHELVFILKAPPSAGILWLYVLYKEYGILSSSQIYGFAFNKKHYFKKNFFKFSRHNWKEEKKLFKKIVSDI
jgi:hypothetical protein